MSFALPGLKTPGELLLGGGLLLLYAVRIFRPRSRLAEKAGLSVGAGSEI
jgi:hypothetical protein